VPVLRKIAVAEAQEVSANCRFLESRVLAVWQLRPALARWVEFAAQLAGSEPAPAFGPAEQFDAAQPALAAAGLPEVGPELERLGPE